MQDKYRLVLFAGNGSEHFLPLNADNLRDAEEEAREILRQEEIGISSPGAVTIFRCALLPSWRVEKTQAAATATPVPPSQRLRGA